MGMKRVYYDMFVSKDFAMSSKFSSEYARQVFLPPHVTLEQLASSIVEDDLRRVKAVWSGDVVRHIVFRELSTVQIGTYRVVYNCETGKAVAEAV